ncbi:hypothetical protein KL918_002114 [Ogataea parapolymorpha]|uniref:Uncharacterized protein n=1 Tax=Ogataea parapolymorpha (strain ATCC 26012 / BCRC 20466 / JCM 22074 / NRRL Y-7560 / DL-1) TaxID=871575 RepID=W1QF29_OGAPD|nr:hypothetical protein HPODL_04122 [Ogataea parapolymorpha DL-1]ESW98498.1 hypothetical protein HPODL_04122 [Ogataea parapolymorpha DL-1]KAG7868456.1 hypothetical protein KL918_002114 [Ogataea parapolymorpha]KAG7873406.1 hypothetical protein KL916_002355 [Ogataea parapolymorpha]
MRVTKKGRKEEVVAIKQDPELVDGSGLASPAVSYDGSSSASCGKLRNLEQMNSGIGSVRTRDSSIELESSFLVMPVNRNSQMTSKGPPSYTKKIWKINKFKTDDAEKQSKIIQDAQNLVLNDSSAKTNKHGFRKTNVKPKVSKEGTPKEFLFVNCTPTAAAESPADEHEKKATAGPRRVSRLFGSRSLKKDKDSKEADSQPQTVKTEAQEEIPNGRMPFLNSSPSVFVGPESSKRSSLRKFCSRKPKGEVHQPGDSSSAATPSEYSLTPKSATGNSNAPYTPITPILSTSSSMTSMVSSATPQPENFTGFGQYPTPFTMSATAGARDRSDSGNSIYQSLQNKQLLQSPMVNTPSQHGDDESGTTYDELVEVSPVSTSVTKKMKTLRRSNSIISVISLSSQSQYPPSSLSSGGFYGLGAAFSPSNPGSGFSSNRVAPRTRSASNTVPNTAQKYPLIKTLSHQNMQYAYPTVPKNAPAGGNQPLFDPQFINHNEYSPFAQQQQLDTYFEASPSSQETSYPYALTMEELKKQHDDLIQQHQSLFYSFGPIEQEQIPVAKYGTPVTSLYSSAPLGHSNSTFTTNSAEDPSQTQTGLDQESFDLCSFIDGNRHCN